MSQCLRNAFSKRRTIKKSLASMVDIVVNEAL